MLYVVYCWEPYNICKIAKGSYLTFLSLQEKKLIYFSAIQIQFQKWDTELLICINRAVKKTLESVWLPKNKGNKAWNEKLAYSLWHIVEDLGKTVAWEKNWKITGLTYANFIRSGV